MGKVLDQLLLLLREVLPLSVQVNGKKDKFDGVG